ncbi:MAG: hypothetical protein COT13_03925 [Chloroflexi bacterium CG08_land_8_20_14_0_20_45_12]|nr:MAG: hypothetical protein AUK00_02880 [Dehalococcoidia bacterium CG2_30_46_9]PIU23277.1 MAG: hypothetical protein COT13_03925 [Chloroflexi bacterium CG08_land_8_20_14_0_20_45_12]PIX27690.1 MAG: hypothetical protein COZ67_00915 [Chloroflexi bacterium CG_4_8_14_3_um_filter_45_15]
MVVLCEIATPSAHNDEPNYMPQLALLDDTSLVRDGEEQQLVLLNFVDFSPVPYKLAYQAFQGLLLPFQSSQP